MTEGAAMAAGPDAAAASARLAEFTGLRPLLFSVAYRMLGVASDAEDVLQEAWLRYAEADEVARARPYLVQVVTRLCLDELRSAHARRVSYVGPWLPEPVLTGASAVDDPLAAVERQERLSLGALALLEQLSAAERAVLVLREGLAYSHAEIAGAVGVSAQASRQLLARARRRLADGPPRQDADPAAHRRLLDALVAALSTGDTASLVRLLRDDVHPAAGRAVADPAARRPGRSRGGQRAAGARRVRRR
jgi:RNA polymerase sigma factor (sigma-70 family)